MQSVVLIQKVEVWMYVELWTYNLLAGYFMIIINLTISSILYIPCKWIEKSHDVIAK